LDLFRSGRAGRSGSLQAQARFRRFQLEMRGVLAGE
jgi:hypothetical protein